MYRKFVKALKKIKVHFSKWYTSFCKPVPECFKDVPGMVKEKRITSFNNSPEKVS